MLTVPVDVFVKVIWFAVVACDCLVKPIPTSKLIARATAILRRTLSQGSGSALGTTSIQLHFGHLMIDSDARVVRVDEIVVDLTRTEFDLLEIMAERPKTVFSRRQLLESVWGGDWYGEIHVVDVHIGHLRKKLATAGLAEEAIRSVRGIGYGLAM